jgi:pimeloyl-ACP methyl ester carboxylesterase
LATVRSSLEDSRQSQWGGSDSICTKSYRKFAERDYSTITHWSEFDRGGHFAAMEQPELYVGDLRTFVGSLDGR